MRGLIDNKGELFAYLLGDQLFTLDDELSGHVRGDYVVDLAGNKVWRVRGDAVYMLDGLHPVGFFGAERPSRYDF